MRSPQLTFVFILFAFFSSFANTDLPVFNYIDKYSVIAVEEMNRTGIPASITLAQGIIESRYGMSGLAKNSNNHFGIKCNNNWTGGEYYYKDDDYVNGKLIKSCFRTYANPVESYYDHSEFLMVNQRYAFLFAYDKTNYKAWAKGLKKAGYATAKDYAATLINTIEKYKLYEYDKTSNNLLVAQKNRTLMTPKSERIPNDYLNFTLSTHQVVTTQPYAESLVAQAPPQATAIPTNYQPGDGFRNNTEASRTYTFNEDVYGGSSRYLDEITPQSLGRE